MQRIYTNEYEVTEYLIGGSIIKYPMKFSSKDNILKYFELRMSSNTLAEITAEMKIPNDDILTWGSKPTEANALLYPDDSILYPENGL